MNTRLYKIKQENKKREYVLVSWIDKHCKQCGRFMKRYINEWDNCSGCSKERYIKYQKKYRQRDYVKEHDRERNKTELRRDYERARGYLRYRNLLKYYR